MADPEGAEGDHEPDRFHFSIRRRTLIWALVVSGAAAMATAAFFIGLSVSHSSGPVAKPSVATTSTRPIQAAAPSTTAAPTTTVAISTTTAAPAQPAVLDCVGNTPLVNPGRIILACASGNALIQGIGWSSWTASSATGTGTYVFSGCAINCPPGSSTDYVASLTLSNPGQTQYGLIFQTLVFTKNGQSVTYSLPGSR